MTDRDRAEMRALADQFHQLTAREKEVQLFDHETRQRIGEAIGENSSPRTAMWFAEIWTMLLRGRTRYCAKLAGDQPDSPADKEIAEAGRRGPKISKEIAKKIKHRPGRRPVTTAPLQAPGIEHIEQRWMGWLGAGRHSCLSFDIAAAIFNRAAWNAAGTNWAFST
jgi:hypothetical protein